MLVLAVDSSTPAITAAIAQVTTGDVVLRAHRCAVDSRAHGELLAPAVADVLAEAGARPTDLTAVVAGVGPGPFTGLRVGLVTAASIGHAVGVPTYGVCSLDVIGWAASRAAPADAPARILVATDARRREVYWAVYADGQRVTDPAVDRPAVVAARAAEWGVSAAVGDGAHRYADVLGLPVWEEPRYPPAEALVRLAAERIRTKAPGEPLTPLYLRRPDAEVPTSRKPVLQ